MLDQRVVAKSQKLKEAQMIFRQSTGQFVKKTSILGSFASSLTALIIITLIIDVVLIKDAGDNYLNLITKSRKEGTPKTESDALIDIALNVSAISTIRVAIIVAQVFNILITWINQYILDGYLISTPVSFVIFVGILFATQEWLNLDWYERQRMVQESDSDDIKEAYDIMKTSTIMIKINCLLAGLTHLINVFA